MSLHVAPIVEGETEAGCLKLILTRVWKELLKADEREILAVHDAFVTGRHAITRPNHPELAEKVERAARLLRARVRPKAGDRGLILILLDAEEDCPKALAPELLAHAKAARSDMDFVCVLAKREIENWFKAAADSLRGVCGLPDDLTTPPDPEVGSGDSWLTRQMQKRDRSRKYKKPADALEIVGRLDLSICRQNSPSFDKLCREFEARVTPPESGSGG